MPSKLSLREKIYGTTTVGARGQVVIPALARKDLKLKTGDQLIVIGKLGKVLGLIKADQIESLVTAIMDNLDGPVTKRQMQTQAEQFIKQLKSKTI